MTKELIQNYTRKISSASGTEIIVILYELCERYIDDGVVAAKEGNHEEMRIQCGNAQKVLNDLIGALDFTYELAMPLYRIYEYITKEISLAVIKNDPDRMLKCKGFLSSLKESFAKISQEDESGPVMGNAQTVYAGLTYGRGTLNEDVTAQLPNRGYKA